MSNEPLKIFIGHDHRQPVAHTVLQHSIYNRCTKPVAITPLVLPTLPIKRQGLTPFTYSRFLVPWLCDYKGWALFLDIDIALKDDISKLFSFANDKYAVMVSKNKIRYEWASVMLFNCAKCTQLTPEFVEEFTRLHTIEWAKEEEVGDLPREWNHLVGYDKPREDAKLIHYTQGIPAWKETQDSEYAAFWEHEHKAANGAREWKDLMGNSKHALPDKDGNLVPRYKMEPPA